MEAFSLYGWRMIGHRVVRYEALVLLNICPLCLVPHNTTFTLTMTHLSILYTTQEMSALPSFQHVELFCSAGERVRPTRDCMSWGGVVKLFNQDIEALQVRVSFGLLGLWLFLSLLL